MSRLFITGCDSNTEWQLPWFVKNFQRHMPNEELIIYDFGMERSSQFANMRKSLRGAESMKGWFKKTAALVQASAFAENICWLDTDCEIRDDISDIFDKVEDHKLSMAIDQPWTTRRPESGEWYNSGVIAYTNKNGVPDVLLDWRDRCRETNLVGDQEVLHSMMSPLAKMVFITTLPNEYNVLRLQIQDNTCPKRVRVMHWTGQRGNDEITRQLSTIENGIRE